MDCTKVGNLIRSLRIEKGLTQKAFAQKLNISDRTVSKWERGLGLPDVSLLNELSSALGVDTEKLLLGFLEPNERDSGNMKKVKFYYCPKCANVILGTGESEISCCGRKLSALEVKDTDSEHEIKLEEIEDEYLLTVNHEMKKDHYINFIAYAALDRVLLIRLYPEQSAQVRVPRLGAGRVYFCCNKDGLFCKKVEKKKRVRETIDRLPKLP